MGHQCQDKDYRQNLAHEQTRISRPRSKLPILYNVSYVTLQLLVKWRPPANRKLHDFAKPTIRKRFSWRLSTKARTRKQTCFKSCAKRAKCNGKVCSLMGQWRFCIDYRARFDKFGFALNSAGPMSSIIYSVAATGFLRRGTLVDTVSWLQQAIGRLGRQLREHLHFTARRTAKTLFQKHFSRAGHQIAALLCY